MNQQQQKVEESIDELQKVLATLKQNPEENRHKIEQTEKDIFTLQSTYNKVKLILSKEPSVEVDAMESLLVEFRDPGIADQIRFMISLQIDSLLRDLSGEAEHDEKMFLSIIKTLEGAKWVIASITREVAGLPSNQPSTEVTDLLNALHQIKERLQGPVMQINLVEIQNICDETIEKVTGLEVANG